MIAVSERIKAINGTRSLSELIPWAVALTPQLVLCKDGALLAGFTYEGLDTEGRGENEQASDSHLLERALSSFASRRVMAWWVVRRDRSDGWAGGDFADPVAARIDAAARKNWQKESHYVNRRTLWILIAAPTPAETLVARIAQEGVKGGVHGVFPWLRSVISGKLSFEHDAKRLLARVSEAESLFKRVHTLFPDAKFHRLNGGALFGWLNALASPAEAWHKVNYRSSTQGLDDVMGENTLDQDAAGMVFSGPSRKIYCAALTIKTLPESWPEYVWPGILDQIIDIDCECVFSMGTRYFDPEEARSVVKERRRHLVNWRKGMGGYLKESLLNVQSDQVDSDKDIHANDADGALKDLAHSPAAGLIFPILYVRAGSQEKMESAIADAARAFHIAGFTVLRERLHQISCWAGTLPGQWAEPVRWTYASGAAIADIAPIRGAPRGSPICRHLSNMSGKVQPALATFPTRTQEPYWLEPHLGDVGHGLILGPTGSGKSVLGGWMAMRWPQYPKSRVFIFDKDRSLRKVVLACGGDYLGDQGQLKINPFHALDSDEDWRWVSDFVVSLLSPADKEMDSTDVMEVSNACRRVRTLNPQDRRLRSLKALLPLSLGDKLSQWVGDGRYAGYFDHNEDAMTTLGSMVGIAVDEVLRFLPAARAFMDLAFHRISKLLDGSPVYIHIEEAWFVLADEQFVKKLDDWSRTLRKLNGLLVLSTQALSELSGSSAFSGFALSPNKFLLPNPSISSFEGLYRENLGLTGEQIEIVASAKPKGEVVLIRNGRTRVLNVSIPDEGMALLRADAEADEVFARWFDSGDPQWRMRYVDEMVGNKSIAH